MPEPDVRTGFAEDADVSRLAARFGVSPLAIQWPLYSFNLADRPPT
jgi:hypothetical protein